MCVREREYVGGREEDVCVCEREREREYVGGREEDVCVCERERESM